MTQLLSAPAELKAAVFSPEVVTSIVQSVGLTATPEFIAPILNDTHEKLYAGGWRGSKTVHLGLEGQVRIVYWKGLNQLTRTELRPRGQQFLVWLVGPDYVQTEEEFRYLTEWNTLLRDVTYQSVPQEGSRTLIVAGCITIETKSANDFKKLGSVAPDLILGCEAGQLSEDVRKQLQGRSFEKNCPIIWGGTFENKEGKETHAWYAQKAEEWLENPEPRTSAYSLPSWENPIFASCRPAVDDDPTLAVFCPDENHGVAHGGRIHPSVKQLEQEYDTWTFDRYVAAIPNGIQDAVYRVAKEKQETTLRIIAQTENLEPIIGRPGGMDFGSVHPTVMVVGHVIPDLRDSLPSFKGLPKGILIIREARWMESNPRDMDGTVKCDPNDSGLIRRFKRELSDTWGTNQWTFDPNERFMAGDLSEQGESTSYSESAREARVSLLVTRFNYNKIIFDITGSGVRKLYAQVCRIQRRKTASGKMEYRRVDDDGAAALEDCVEAWDGKPHFTVPKSVDRGGHKERFSWQTRKEYKRLA